MRNYNYKKLSTLLRPCFFLMVMVFTATSFAQVKISGKVTNEKGEGVSNVSVTLKNNIAGTTTNADGSYILSAALKSGKNTIIFSGVGYSNYEQIVNATGDLSYSINAQLTSDILGMDEVVVIGSSLSAKRKQLGNTVNTVTGKQLQNTGSGNIGSALQGKIPGAQITQTSGDPAGGISVRMRGTSSISGSSEPLYIIDGVVVNNATTNVTGLYADGGRESAIGTNRLADINPNDIEKLDVIPGAAASAIYGSRASNGVVLITTKKGKSGQTKIDFSTSLSSSSLRKKVYISKYGKMFGIKNFTNNGQPYALGIISNAPTTTNGYTGTVAPAYTRPTDGIVRTFAADVVDAVKYDYQDDIFRKAMGTDNYLAVSGGTDKTKYYFSGGYFKNEGIIQNTDFRRYNFKTRIEQNVSKYLTILGGLSYTSSFANEKPNGNVFTSPINSMNITNNVFDIKARDAAGNLAGVDWVRINPVSALEEMKFTNKVNRVIGDIQFKIKPIDNLSIDYILGVDNIAQEGNSYIQRYAYGISNNVSAGNKPLGYAASAFINTQQINNDINLSYSTNFSKFSSLTTVGFNHQYQNLTSLISEGDDLLNGITTVSGAAVVSAPRYGDEKLQTFGGFVQETFGYDNLVFITAAGRIDGSTVFPKDSRTFFYPKLSAAVNLSDFDFWKKSKLSAIVNTARVRSSWGLAGNLTGIGAYSRFTAFSAAAINTTTGYNLNTALGNQIVQPERLREVEVGVDLSFLNNKLGVVFNVYDKKTIDNSLLVLRNLAPSSGGLGKYENVGNMTNKGWELSVNANPIASKNFNWSLFGSVSRNKNLVTASTQVAPIFLGNALGANSFIIQAGAPAGAFYGNYFARDANGNMIKDAAGRLTGALNGTTAALKILGSPHPDWIVSFGTGLEYKKFTFNALLDGALGQEVFNADRRTRQGVGIGDLAEKEIKGELPRGYIFALYVTEEYRIESGSYIKLRELSLSYQIPSFAKFIKSASVSITGRNLISFDTYDGYDPETNAGGNSSVLRGIDFGNVPNPKTFQITLKSTF